MIDKCDIKGTPEVYTIAVNCCSQNGNWELAHSIYGDMSKKGVNPDEVLTFKLLWLHVEVLIVKLLWLEIFFLHFDGLKFLYFFFKIL